MKAAREDYFEIKVTGERKDEVDRRVAELQERGFELISTHTDSETRKMFSINHDRFGPKKRFANDFTTNKIIAIMRRPNRLAE